MKMRIGLAIFIVVPWLVSRMLVPGDGTQRHRMIAPARDSSKPDADPESSGSTGTGALTAGRRSALTGYPKGTSRGTSGLQSLADVAGGMAPANDAVVHAPPPPDATPGFNARGKSDTARQGRSLSDTENAVLANASYVWIGGATPAAAGWERRGPPA